MTDGVMDGSKRNIVLLGCLSVDVTGSFLSGPCDGKRLSENALPPELNN